MNREEDNKPAVPNEASQADKANRSNTGNERQIGNDQYSYPGAMDQVEGRMNNGEIGSGITKAEEDADR